MCSRPVAICRFFSVNSYCRDKRDCNTILAKTDATTCLLTGESTSTKRIPDATFGLSTYVASQCQDHSTPCDYRHCPYRFSNWNATLQRDKLERLTLHSSCGLLSDPKWGENDMAFPFMVYEAKGWSGDYREARRQACLAAKTYLDMLDELSRVPGPVGSPRGFQTDTSHNNQAFALTNYGAHWHLLLPFKKPREEDQHANAEGLSENAYVSALPLTELLVWNTNGLIITTDFSEDMERKSHPRETSLATSLPYRPDSPICDDSVPRLRDSTSSTVAHVLRPQFCPRLAIALFRVVASEAEEEESYHCSGLTSTQLVPVYEQRGKRKASKQS